MNWKQRFFKPNWQNKSADVRLESVSTEQAPELINSLLEIAAGDSDPRVRCAAVKRLHQLGNILKLYASETDPTVKALQEDRIRQLAAATNETRPPLDVRMQVIKLTSDRTLIEHLAQNAPEAELRRAAIEKVKRQGVLGDCCIADKKIENRRLAASLISQHTTLKRVIDALRKSDKVLHAELQDRLQHELIEKADPKAIQAEALRICIHLEHLELETRLEIETQQRESKELDALHKDWKKIAANTPAAMTERYQRICERLAAPPVVVEVEVQIPVTQAPVDVVPEVSAAAETPEATTAVQASDELVRVATDICLYEVENPQRPNAKKLSGLRTQLEKFWQQCDPATADDKVAWSEASDSLQRLEAIIAEKDAIVAEKQESFDKQLTQAQTLFGKFSTELDDGELHKALETRAELQQALTDHDNKKISQSINSQLAGLHPRVSELRDWLHWSNNKIRKRLIAEMEVLPAADLHPDALLDRVKSLQTEWKTLEQSEQIPGDKHFASASWMWRKFSSAGHTAFDTAKPYLDKRSEIQSKHAQSLSTFCAELEQLIQADPQDWTALSKGMTRGRKKLHDLNNIPARQRQKLAHKLKAALDNANRKIQEHYKDVENEKMKLIRAASQLIHMPERSDAISEAKSLQSNWKAAGSLWRSKEQELWNQFREHLDPLFEELKEQQASVRMASEENLGAQKTLCSEMKELLKSTDDLTTLHGKVQGLHDAWKDIEKPDRKLLETFQKLLSDYQQRVKKAEIKQVDAGRERIWLKSNLLHELSVTGRTAKGALSKTTAGKVTKAWPDFESSDVFEKSLDQAYTELLAGELPESNADALEKLIEQARLLCIRLEFIAGLPSPEEDRNQRMQYQVDRLAESMSGDGVRQPAREEASEIETLWLAMYALPQDSFKVFSQRIKKALSVITENT